jgi:hypothetical protein
MDEESLIAAAAVVEAVDVARHVDLTAAVVVVVVVVERVSPQQTSLPVDFRSNKANKDSVSALDVAVVVVVVVVDSVEDQMNFF